MDLQEFAIQYPELYDELLSRVNGFIDQHNITGDVPLIEWDDMLDLILQDLNPAQYMGNDTLRYQAAVPTSGPVNSRPGGSRPPGGNSRPPGGNGNTRPPAVSRPPAASRPPARPRPPVGPTYPGYGYGGGPLKDVLRLLFLQELLDRGY